MANEDDANHVMLELTARSSFSVDDVTFVVERIEYHAGLSQHAFISSSCYADLEATLSVAYEMAEDSESLSQIRTKILSHIDQLIKIACTPDTMNSFKLLVKLLLKIGEDIDGGFNISADTLNNLCKIMYNYKDLDREALELTLKLIKCIMMVTSNKTSLLTSYCTIGESLIMILSAEKPYQSLYTNTLLVQSLMEVLATLTTTDRDDEHYKQLKGLILKFSDNTSFVSDIRLLLSKIIHNNQASQAELLGVLYPTLQVVYNLTVLQAQAVNNDILVQVLFQHLANFEESSQRNTFTLTMKIINSLLTRDSSFKSSTLNTIYGKHFKTFEVFLKEGNDQILTLELLNSMLRTNNTKFLRSLFKNISVSSLFCDILNANKDDTLTEKLLDVVDSIIFPTVEYHDAIFTNKFMDSLVKVLTSDKIKCKTKVNVFRILEVFASANVTKTASLLTEEQRQVIWEISNGNSDMVSQPLQVKALQFIKKYMISTDSHVCKFKSRLSHVSLKLLSVILLFRSIINNSVWIIDLYSLELMKSSIGAVIWTIMVSIYINFLSLQAFNTRMRSGHTSAILSVHGVRQTFFRKYFCPWPWDRPIGVLFNVLTLAQLHRVVNLVEIFLHPPLTLQEHLSITYNNQRLTLQSSLLLNIPLLILRIILVSDNLLPGSLATTIATAFISIVMVSYDLYSFESCCYSASYIGNYGLNAIYHYIVVVGYIAMISGRMIMFFLLYLWLGHKTWVIVVVVTIHFTATLLINLFVKHSMYKAWLSEPRQRMKHRFTTLKYLKYSGTSQTATPLKSFVNLLSLLMYNGVEVLLVTLRHPLDFLHNRPHHWHRRNLRYFFLFFLLHFGEIITVFTVAQLGHITTSLPQIANVRTPALGIASVVLYVLSGVLFFLYIWLLNPVKRGVYDATRMDHRKDASSPIDATLNFCDLRPKYRKRTYENIQKTVLNRPFLGKYLKKCDVRSSYYDIVLLDSVPEFKTEWFLRKWSCIDEGNL